MAYLSAVLITKNEENNIPDCLASLSLADEIVVLDTGSQDNSVKLCQSLGAKVYLQDKWEGFGKAKQRAVEYATHDWILSIDADERLSPELQEELKSLKDRDFEGKAWHLRRLSYYLGKPIRFCGWQSDAPLRIFHRQQGGFNDKAVHEGIKVTQDQSTCKHWLYHLTYPTLKSHYDKIRFYADLAGKNDASAPIAGLLALHKFLKMYIFKLGFLDGWHGFLLCKNSAWGIWVKYRR